MLTLPTVYMSAVTPGIVHKGPAAARSPGARGSFLPRMIHAREIQSDGPRPVPLGNTDLRSVPNMASLTSVGLGSRSRHRRQRSRSRGHRRRGGNLSNDRSGSGSDSYSSSWSEADHGSGVGGTDGRPALLRQHSAKVGDGVGGRGDEMTSERAGRDVEANGIIR